MYKRTDTRAVKVKNILIGHQNHVVLQSMLNTKTKDIAASVRQINDLVTNGCELVRFAVFDREDALAIKEIRRQVDVPLVADIHFDYQLALLSIENGIDKIRLNPGNIGSLDHVREVVAACQEHHVPIRIGINTGSLEKDVLVKYGGPSKEAMIESAQKHVDLLESLHFNDIIISFKSSDVTLTIDTYRLAAERYPYPLHLGITEAGTYNISAIKSSAALGPLLYQGIGDTIRISVSSDPVEELKIGKQLLKCFNLIDKVPNLISCPTCGRIQYDMLPIAYQIEQYLNNIHADITVAIMGCAVNGPQEASRADIGIAGGKNEALLFKKGQIIRKIPQKEIYEQLVLEINKLVKEKNQ
ncbi:MAG: flavodoxin-dependent (E)-4-hydroxy-3-methylbut-2-enyl-diphosphate synthase [Erysipelotrichaceae bacterium]|nr:flavodoxin-dependent (E)-4-hydroxy-3-methylbut-2-enyl-diphosphate synthase [Erysipelotrichaceae bacterium]